MADCRKCGEKSGSHKPVKIPVGIELIPHYLVESFTCSCGNAQDGLVTQDSPEDEDGFGTEILFSEVFYEEKVLHEDGSITFSAQFGSDVFEFHVMKKAAQ